MAELAALRPCGLAALRYSPTRAPARPRHRSARPEWQQAAAVARATPPAQAPPREAGNADGPAPLPPPVQKNLQQQRAGKQAATASAASSTAPPPPAPTEPSPASTLADRLAQLAEAAQQTAVRLRRQLEPPPPGFPRGPSGDSAVALLQQPLGFLERLRDEYGGVVGLLMGGERVVLVADPTAARAVLLEPPGRAPPFVKAGTAFFPSSSLAGNGLLTSDGEVWRRQRRLVNPAFRRSAVDRYAQAMLGATATLTTRRWRDGAARDVYADFNSLTLDITLEALFGGGAGSSSGDSSSGGGAGITGAIQQAFAFFARRGAAAMVLPEWVPTPDNLGFAGAVARLDRAVYGLIADRRRELSVLAQQHPGEASAPVVPRDLLDSLLLARGEGGEQMGDRAARDELMTLLVAGQETSAILLGWACAYLAHHPEAQAAAAAEVRALLGGSSPGGMGAEGRPLEASDVWRLPFVEAVVLEAMRLSPPAYLVGRCAAEDASLAGRYLQKGTTVLVSPYLLHRDPAIWGPDAATFRPERWLEMAAAAAAGNAQPPVQAQGCPHSSGGSGGGSSSAAAVFGGFSSGFLTGLGPHSAYLPFGAGQRNCVGTGFAMVEAVLVLAAVLRRWRLQPLPGAAFPEAQPQITLRPAAVRLLLRRRRER